MPDVMMGCSCMQMCEWLSSHEWCDVQIICGGRTLHAHRAVLASVSHFLKNLLLSCPLEETPTLIVLPDFDFEAMSSVLNYIYNGEVIVKRHKIHMFLDITRAMQIFVKEQCFISSDFTPKNAGLIESVVNEALEPVKYGTQPYINIKKSEQRHDILQPISPTALDLRDKHAKRARFWDWSEHCNASLGNVQLPYEGRQRSSFLRDLYIETYPWNGNVNGGAASVSGILNGRYHGSTSASLTNANCNHPAAISDVSEKTGVLHLSKHAFEISNLIRNQRCLTNNISFSREYNRQYQPEFPLCESFPTGKFPAFTKYSTFNVNKSKSTPTCRSTEKQQNQCLLPNAEQITERHQLKYLHSPMTTKRCKETIRLISNKVLNSPWCPHPPNGYKPFHRNLTSTKCPENINIVKVPLIEENDSNNNVQESSEIAKAAFTEETEDRKTSYSAERNLKCNICSQIFTSDEALRSHSKSHNAYARYSCSECSKSFSQLRNYKYHMSVHRGTREFAATCTVCGKYFNDRGYLSSHMKIHRNRKEYKCTQCPKSFNQRVAYNMHVRIHTGVKPHVCEQCNKAFSRKMLLKQHQRTHSGERPYACAHCDKRFADRSNMTLHLRLHTGVKPFSCTLCPKSFTKKHHLKSHLNFHTGAKPYSCSKCKLAFTQSSNMRTHYKKCNASGSEESSSQAADRK